jgi:hypothetical protein
MFGSNEEEKKMFLKLTTHTSDSVGDCLLINVYSITVFLIYDRRFTLSLKLIQESLSERAAQASYKFLFRAHRK